MLKNIKINKQNVLKFLKIISCTCCLHLCAHTHVHTSACGDQERALDTPELELEAVRGELPDTGAGNQIGPLLTTETSLQSVLKFLIFSLHLFCFVWG